VTTKATIASLVESLRDRPDGCRAVGSATSKNDCFKTNGIRIAEVDLSSLNWVGDGVIRASAWTILRDVVAFAAQAGWAIATIGEWAGQTLGGVIATGTHGGSYRYGSIVSSVVRVEVMNAQGQVSVLDRGTDDFFATLNSFGTTGIIVTADVKCEPLFDIALQRRRLSIEQYARDLVANSAQVDYRASVWASSTPWVIDYAGHKTSKAPTANVATRREQRFGDKNSVYEWLASRLTFSLPMSTIASKHYQNRYDRILAPIDGDAAEILKRRKKQRTPQECEFAIDLQRAEEFLAALLELLRRRKKYPDRLIGLRPLAGDSCWLSPTQNKTCLWVSFFIHASNPLVPELCELLTRYSARPHWGKHLLLAPASIAALYPRWDEFLDKRRAFDPGRVFVNDFAAQLGM
jgi:FAD/FMN-containing dehydrogenase